MQNVTFQDRSVNRFLHEHREEDATARGRAGKASPEWEPKNEGFHSGAGEERMKGQAR